MTDEQQPDVVHVTMIWPFYKQFVSWATHRGFRVEHVPGTSPNTRVVVPSLELMNRTPPTQP